MFTNFSLKKGKLLLLFAVASCNFSTQAQNIYSVVGTGSSGTPSDGVSAISSSLANVNGLGFDATGNMYICDISDHTIRKVDITTGIISTVVGMHGLSGSTGDGGAATSARINYPVNIVFDYLGNLYFSDLLGHRVRKVTPAGIISTIAGNGTATSTGDGAAATSATLNQPTGMAADKLGNIYVSEIEGNRIRKISTSGTITTFAGTGSASSGGDGGAATAASLNKPRGLIFDTTGNLYVVEESGNRLRKINTSGVISTVAGNGSSSSTGDGGISTAATINSPRGITMDSLGNIFVTEGNGSRIRKINPSGTISTFAGTGAYGYTGEGGAATAATIKFTMDIAMFRNNIYFSDFDAASIRMICVAGPVAPTLSTRVFSFCEAAASTPLTAVGYTLKWYNAITGGSPLSSAPSPSTVTAGIQHYYVSQTYFNAGCESPRVSVQVNINPKPDNVVITPMSALTFCAGDSVILKTSSQVRMSIGATPFFTASGRSNGSINCNCPVGSAIVGYNVRTGNIMDGVNFICKPISRFGVIGTSTSTTAMNGGSGGSLHGPYTFGGTELMTGVKVTDAAFLSGYTLNGISGYGQAFSYVKSLLDNTTTPATLTEVSGTNTVINTGYLWAPDGTVFTGMIANGDSYSSSIGFQYTPIGAFEYHQLWSNADTAESIVVKTSGNYSYTTTNSLGCSATSPVVNVIMNPFPAAPVVTSPITYCQGETPAALTAVGSNLKWYAATTGGSPITTPVVSTAVAGTFTYYVSQTTSIASCEGPRATITVIVNPKPVAPTVTTPVNLCTGIATTALTAIPSGATDTLLWYNVPSLGTPSKTAPTPDVSAATTTNYYVSQKTALGCEGPRALLKVIVNATPAAPVVVTPVAYCQNATAIALTATKSATTDTLFWYNAATGGTGSTTSPVPSTATTGTTPFYVSLKSNLGCEGIRATINVIINTLPAAPAITTPVQLCVGVPATALTATGTGLLWYAAATGGTGNTAAPVQSTTATGSTTYYVSQTIAATSCEGPRAAITAVVNSLPAAPTVITPIQLCLAGPGAALSATGSSLKWYNAATGGASVATPTPSTAALGSTNYYVSQTSAATAGSCEGSRASITVTVNALPAAPVVVTPLNICVGIPAAVLKATGTNLKWYTVSSAGTALPATPVPSSASTGSVNYYVSQTSDASVGSCEGPRATLAVTVQPSPILTLSPLGVPDYVFCEGKKVTIKSVAPTAVSYQWQYMGAPVTGQTYDTFTTGTKGYYGVTVKNVYGCFTTDSVLVKDNPLAFPSLSPKDVQQCEGISIMLYSKPANPLYTYQWIKNGTPMAVPFSQNKTAVDLSGIYSVIVTDIYNCVRNTNDASVSTYPAIPKPTIIRVDPILKLDKIYNTYQWYRNNKAIAGATSPSYRMIFDGTYFAEVNDRTDCFNHSDTVQVASLGIDNVNANEMAISIYPNPTRNIVTVDAQLSVNLIVRDIVGKTIITKQNATFVDLENFADGTYFLSVADSLNNVIKVFKLQKISQ